MALNEYGKDFIKVARILGTKSESIVRDFYNKYNDRYDLDAFIGKENERLEETTKTSPEHLGDESVTPDPSPMNMTALATEVKKDPEIETLILNGLLESAPKNPFAELEPPCIVTAPLKHSPRGLSHAETLSAPGESSSPKISHISASEEAFEQESNQSAQNVISNKAEVGKIDEEEESNIQSTRGQKRPPREGVAKTTPLKSIERPTVSKRRRSRRSVDDAQVTPSRRTRTSNAVATASRVRSGMQTRRSAVEKEKVDQQTRSRKQKQGVETREGKAMANRNRRGHPEGGREKVGERKRKIVEAEESTVSTRRRTSLPNQLSVSTASSRKRTRASTTTSSSRLSTRQRR
ncbi:REST corepressor [Taenia solium]|eukprot:TsM_000485000 transcript=TsM_000485000 gene=TsM_000485000